MNTDKSKRAETRPRNAMSSSRLVNAQKVAAHILNSACVMITSASVSACGGSSSGTQTASAQVATTSALTSTTSTDTPSVPIPVTTSSTDTPSVTVPVVTSSIGDSQNYYNGSFLAYNSPWGAGSLIAGTDYSDTTTYIPATFPAASTISWKWPAPKNCASVCGFMFIQWGFQFVDVPEPIASKRINDITTLMQTINIAPGGTTDGYDVIDDIFTTGTSKGVQVHEIEVFLHSSTTSVNYFGSQPQIGAFKDIYGRSWQVANAGSDKLFMPVDHSDVVTGIIDIKAMLSYLISQNQISGLEYFNGLQIGSEPVYGSGSLLFNLLGFVYN